MEGLLGLPRLVYLEHLQKGVSLKVLVETLVILGEQEEQVQMLLIPSFLIIL